MSLGVDEPPGEGSLIPGHLALDGVLGQDLERLRAEGVPPGVGRGVPLEQLVAEQDPKKAPVLPDGEIVGFVGGGEVQAQVDLAPVGRGRGGARG